MADLNQIYQAIGSLQTSITQMENELKRDRTEASESRNRMIAQQDKQAEELAHMRRKHQEFENRHHEFEKQMGRVMPFVNEAERWRQRGIGFAGGLLFLGMIAGVIGAKYVVPALEGVARIFR